MRRRARRSAQTLGAMQYFFGILFVVTVAYSVLGNAVVYFILVRRKVPLSFLWSGTPGYLYRKCVVSPEVVGTGLTRFALSTVVALVVVPIAAIGLFATLPVRT
jgi:hypothetical protein